MTAVPADTRAFEVVLAGGGVAALEAALALHELAGDRVGITLLAPEPEFVHRPSAVMEPFAYAKARRYSLAGFAADIGAGLVADSLAWVDPGERVVHTDSGAQLGYDALLLGLGARAHPRFEHVVTLDDRRIDELLHGLIQDVEDGYVTSLAFIIPARMAWPLPVYELALMIGARASGMNVDPTITVLTSEPGPLAVFGDGASRAVSKLLAENQIDVLTSAHCEVPQSGRIEISPGGRVLEVDRVVALPELSGPAVRGLPAAENGFIPVDQRCQVRGLPRVFAAGDATDFAVKHGSIAAQQADTAAREITALAGLAVELEPFRPEIRGILLTGGQPRYLSARLTGSHGFTSVLSTEPMWTPPAQIAARYLAPYLEQLDGVGPGLPDPTLAFHG